MKKRETLENFDKKARSNGMTYAQAQVAETMEAIGKMERSVTRFGYEKIGDRIKRREREKGAI